jgi:hypothetical protein
MSPGIFSGKCKTTTGGLAQYLFVVSPTNLQLMPCVLGITLHPGDRGESAKPRLSGWLLEVTLRESSFGEKGMENYSGHLETI